MGTANESKRKDTTASKKSGLIAHIATISALWLVAAAVQLTGAYLVPNSSLNSEQIGMPTKLHMLGGELILQLVAVSAIYIVIALVLIPYRKANSFFKVVVAILAALPLLSVLLLLTSEWYALMSMGQFAGLEGFLMWLVNPRQILQHVAQMEPAVTVAVPLSALALVYLFLGIIPQLIRRVGIGAQLAVCSICLAAVVSCSMISTRYGSPERLKSDEALRRINNTYTSTFEVLVSHREQKTGPMLRLVSDIRNRLRERTRDIDISKHRATYRPLISLSDYKAQVDEHSMRRSNVIVMLIDSVRPDQLLASGGAREVMPNLERLAREGRIFLRNYAMASHSNYADPCPLSSHYPLRGQNYHAYPENPTYPRVLIYDILKTLGYRTAVVSSQNENWGQMYNFLQTGNIDYFLHSETFTGPTYVPRNDVGFANFVKGSKHAGKIDDRFTVEEAIKWIGKDPATPFAMYMNFQASHVPYEIPADFPHKFSPTKLDFTIRFGNFPPDKVGVVKDVYADSLAYVDTQLGKLLTYLEQEKLLENTIIVVTGDNGQAFFEHGFAGHANQLYEEAVRVPMVFHGPGVLPVADTQLAGHLDVPPSLLHLLGLPPHPSFQGIDLFADQPPATRSLYLICQTPLAHQYGIVRGDYKLLYDYRTQGIKLFDLKHDPDERQNLAELQHELSSDMLSRVLAWRSYQLGYYESLTLQKESYPPQLVEAPDVVLKSTP